MRTLVAFVLGVIVGWFLARWLVQPREPAQLEQAGWDAIRGRGPSPEQTGAGQTTTAGEDTGAMSKSRQDDLARIKGIGPVFRGRLQEAGIQTFAQLAQTSPERLREIVATAPWQKIEPELWIQQAAQLAE